MLINTPSPNVKAKPCITEVENLEDLQHELMVFLLSKIHLFNPENGAKTYSYFDSPACLDSSPFYTISNILYSIFRQLTIISY